MQTATSALVLGDLVAQEDLGLTLLSGGAGALDREIAINSRLVMTQLADTGDIVIDNDGGVFTADVMGETLRRTSLRTLRPGSQVNLERAAALGSRLGGHLVQGHVDGVGTVLRVAAREDARLLDLQVPPEVARVSVPLGSITVDGVSLTVNAIPAPGTIQISLIPFTLEHTTLADRRPGDRVHLEADTVGKYVQALLERRET